MPRMDLTGQRFGRLTVLRYSHTDRNKKPHWHCLCDCGNESVKCGNLMKVGKTTSCGCAHKEFVSKLRRKHGYSNGTRDQKRLHYIWSGILARCYNKRGKAYKNYGARGIVVCDRWRFGENGKDGFECFIEDMGERPSPDHSVERKENDGPYAPWNCVWADDPTQSRNKRTNIMIEFNGVTKCLKDWAVEYGIAYGTLYWRVQQNWEFRRAINFQEIQKRPLPAPQDF